MSGVVLTVVTVVLPEVVAVVTVRYVVQLPPPLRVSADVLNSPPLVRQPDQQYQTLKHLSALSLSQDNVGNFTQTDQDYLSELI